MITNPREIVIFYNPDSSSDRKTVAHARGMSRYIKSYSYNQAQLTGTQWQLILDSIDMEDKKKLFNKAHPYYQSDLRGKNFDNESMISILKNNPQLMKSPIAVRNRRAIVCETPTDIYKLA